MKEVIGETPVNNFIAEGTESHLKSCFTALMNADKTLVSSKLLELKNRIDDLGNSFMILHYIYIKKLNFR